MRVLLIAISFIVLGGVKSDRVLEKELERSTYSTIPGCYNKFVGTKGYVQNPVFPPKYGYSMSCEWDFDVTRGFVVEFEFEAFRLPFSDKKSCDSYIEITYESQQEEVVKRMFCPTDTVRTVSTDSQTAHMRFKSGAYHEEYENDKFGFKINYRAVALSKPSGDQHAVKIVLIIFAALSFLAFCACCVRRHRKTSIAPGYNIEVMPQEPNARTFGSHSDFQSSTEYQHTVIQAPHNEQKYLSRTSCVNPDIDSRNYHRRGTASAFASLQGNRKTSIATTPRSVFPESIRDCNSENVRRMQQLKTKLIARFSSHSSPDISVYFQRSGSSTYSYLSCDEGSPEESPREDKNLDFSTREIPSIVIDFVE